MAALPHRAPPMAPTRTGSNWQARRTPAACQLAPEMLPRLAEGAEQFIEPSGVHRLDEMVVEARILGPPPVALLPVAGHGDEAHPLQPLLLPQAAGDLVAVHPRQADVQQHHVGLLGQGEFQRLWPRVDGPDLMA